MKTSLLLPLVVLVGRTVRALARRLGGGTAIPGLVVERLAPWFLPTVLDRLPHGVIVVSGTNGKTTTTKVTADLLTSQGLRVFTNRTGSNFTRGVVSAMLADVSLTGRLPADVAVLELDEAHGVHFARAVRPTHTLLLNVLRDQLDRFGEIDTTARLLERIARATTTTVIANREDSRLVRIGESLEGVAVRWIGLGPATRAAFRSDDELHGGAEGPGPAHEADVELLEYDGDTARFRVGGEELVAPLRLGPVYNAFNATGAIALTRAVLGDRLDLDRVREGLAGIEPAFGRGETFSVDGSPLELVLVKNPAGFRMALAAYPHAGVATMIVINDADADGRDVSWLWDVDFDELRASGVALTSGVRAADMALRLQYDLVPVGGVEDDLEAAVRRFTAENPGPKRIYATYTAMLVLRRILHGSSFGVLA